jgi:glycosyltransferase involved in cell wall biosynthesis
MGSSFLRHKMMYPSYIPMTAWLRHAPFGMWLVKAARPKTLVELGTHHGFSYFAFCEAVRQSDLDTRCIAVDTWKGDEHSGTYGEEVFARVQVENRKYADFSMLLRKTFAEALDDVPDGSVDILHIDGRHFYEDVKEDFESWEPKLAKDAIVLFHDTEVMERGFGVWRFWQEIADKNPTMNFPFQHGLGVYFRGDDLSPELCTFRQLVKDPAGRDAVIALFQSEGDALAHDHTLGVLASQSAAGSGAVAATLRLLDSGEIPPESQIRPLGPGGAALTEALMHAEERAARLHADGERMAAALKAAEERAESLDTDGGQMAAALKGAEDLEANLRVEREQLAAKTAQLQAEALDLRNENRGLRLELAHTRRHVSKAWKERFAFRVLTRLATSRLPIEKRARERFLRSAKKRDPNRSLTGDLHPVEQQALRAAPEPVEKSRFQVLKGKRKSEDTRKNILVAMHEASFTGAPILAQNIMSVLANRYNVYGVMVRGGDLIPDVLEHCVEAVVVGRHPEPGTATARELARFLGNKSLDFAVVNSIVARMVLPILYEMDVTSVSLIHEFASYTRPRTAFTDMVSYSDEVVFSSRLTLDNAAEVAGLEAAPYVHVLPQGKCVVPSNANEEATDPLERQRLRAHLRPPGREDDFLVVGAGHVQIRKGVDLFIEIARACLARSEGGRSMRFVWIGSGYDPENELAYSVYLQDQLRRSGLEDVVHFLPQTTEIDYVYELADVLLLPSRLDPLPNVAIDAMLCGKPVLCFQSATGISDVLRDAGLGKSCVAEYLDTSDMARKLTALAASPALYDETAGRTKSHATAVFDLETYVARLEALALEASERKARAVSDAKIVAAEARFDPRYVLPADQKSPDAATAAKRYLSELSRGPLPRRPEPGFNPHLYYAKAMEGTGLHAEQDPYVHFLTNGRPAGPWMLPVLGRPGDAAPPQAYPELRCALHVHAYYVDTLGSILSHLAANRIKPDVFVTVTDKTASAAAQGALAEYEGRSTLHVVPNVGRDIGPFLTGLGNLLVADYDVIGHVHTKKSLALSNDRLVETWTRFLLENVLGGPSAGAMMDCILDAFVADPKLGVVFPSDPNLLNWSRNRSLAEGLTARIGVGPLPTYFDFPVGTMFWMRADALRPFVDLRLTLEDYPSEPVGYDGTILHALERLFGVVPILQGYGAAVTATPGLTR